jgi:thymidylate synthase ThyX
MLTIDWQKLGVRHGHVTPEALSDAGLESEWSKGIASAADLVNELITACGADVAQYAVPFAYRIRYSMHMNAREAMHFLELRTVEGGHRDYRRVAQTMHTQIREVAGHRLVADALKYVDHNQYELDRLSSERRAEQRRQDAGLVEPRG